MQEEENISCRQFEARKKINNNSSVTFEFGLLWSNSLENVAKICGAVQTLSKEHRARN